MQAFSWQVFEVVLLDPFQYVILYFIKFGILCFPLQPDAGRWVLCQLYKGEKNNDSASSGRFDPYIDNTTVPEPVASDIGAGQIYPSTSQFSSMWASGARGDINQVQYYEMGQSSNTQPNWFSNAATNPDLAGGHMNQDQIPGVDQSCYTPQAGMVYNSQQFPFSSNSNDGFYMDSWNETIYQPWPEY
ncbi:hypothetical protein MRB53_006324 [Persea americana]|uniref:Uncharacterized protein n=1 Tax=Persea americana TaxID=3435 RepID=A0ACC2MFN4_PERAE|nr:hypothetical protein MRB53_006324 [Persea americana]